MLPAVLRELLDLPPAGDVRARASALVPADLLLDTILRRAAQVLPRARIVRPFHLYRGRVDIAILHADITIGILLEPSEPISGGMRTGGGTEPFDHTIAIAAYPKDHLLEEKPPNVWGFRAYTTFDGTIAFEIAREIESPIASSPEVRARLVEKGNRLDAPALDGDVIANALLAHLEARYEALAVVREFACGRSIADVAVITANELHLFEIKGAGDGASRLAHQTPNYDRVATTCTLVTTCNHRSFRGRVPEHWGLMEAAAVRGRTRFMRLRAPQFNPIRNVAHVVDLLGLSDLRGILRANEHLARGSRTVPQLRQAALDAIDELELAPLALQALARRARPG
jgi:hypothetical protein